MNRRDFLANSALFSMLGALPAVAGEPGTAKEAGAIEVDRSAEAGWICSTCGSEFTPSLRAPSGCPICQDSRQFVGWNGQQWTTLAELSRTHENVISEEEPGLYSFHTSPDFAIGQRAFLVRTPEGNLLWDCVALLDESTKSAIRELGGIAAIAISHPHYYTTMVQWSRAFANAPIYLHALNRKWVMRPDPAIRFWKGDTVRLFGGMILIRTGGHFDGFQVLHWQRAADGKSVLLSGDQPEVCMDRRWVTFMYSYPNYIPLNRAAVEGILAALRPFSFDRLHAAFPGRYIGKNAKEVVLSSADRYMAAIS